MVSSRITAERAHLLAEEAIRARLPYWIAPIADPHVRDDGSGSYVVHFRLEQSGVPLFLDAISVEVRDDSIDVNGDVADNVPTDVVPRTVPDEALSIAVEHLHGGGENGVCDAYHAVPRMKRRPTYRRIATFTSPSRPTVFTRGAFGEALTAELTIHQGELAWLVTVVTREREEDLVLVGAAQENRNRVIFCRKITPHACTASLFLFHPAVDVRHTVELPCDITFYPEALRANATNPFDWIDSDATFGNNAGTFFGGQTTRVRAVRTGPDLVFRPVTERDESILNAFFFCNFMHDFFALLGFTEADGAFHQVNATGQGKAGDRLRLYINDQPLGGIGLTRAFRDGVEPEIVLGRYGPTGRHSALEGGVVIHEYVHAVTQRLIGGRNNDKALVKRQSKAVGEAWSDYFAITIQNYYRRLRGIGEDYRFARWCTNSDSRVRTAAYDAHPGTYQQAGRPPYDDEPKAGEVWAAAAIDFTNRLIAALPANDWQKGYERSWRFMFDSWGKSGANPTLLDARDNLFKVITNPGDLRAARESFRARGMGRNARSGKADTLADNRENFDEWI